MSGHRAYLDYNASAPLLPSARAAMLAAFDLSANPSSVHSEGRAARGLIEAARREVAALVGGKAAHVVFTSGATEAATTLLTPGWTMGRAPLRMSRLYVSAADHPCLLNGGRFPVERVVRVGVDSNGIADLDALERALAGHDRSEGLPLVAIHAANNETGILQPLRKIGALVKAAGGVFVVDAVQAAGRIPLDMSLADYMILSSHKIGGPMGVGAFVAASDLMMPLRLIVGGGQEKGHRAGTENLAGIAGFGAAAREALDAVASVSDIAARRACIEQAIVDLAPDATIFGYSAPRIANTVLFSVPGLNAETTQIGFDLEGVALSAGSACSSGKVGPSHVLKAMGYDVQEGGLRVSIGSRTTDREIEQFASALSTILARHAGRTSKAA